VLRYAQIGLSLVFLAIAGYRTITNPAESFTWKNLQPAAYLLIVAALVFLCYWFMNVRRANALFVVAWFTSGLGATAGFFWLCWRTWTNPQAQNWYTIPAIGALAIFAVFVFWIPVLASFNKKSRVLNALEDEINNGGPEADRCLFAAREVVGRGKSFEQAYLDWLEGRVHLNRRHYQMAIPCLLRSVESAMQKDHQPLGFNATRTLVEALIAAGRPEEVEPLIHSAAAYWGWNDEFGHLLASAGVNSAAPAPDRSAPSHPRAFQPASPSPHSSPAPSSPSR
jgi:hypothetical protein